MTQQLNQQDSLENLQAQIRELKQTIEGLTAEAVIREKDIAWLQHVRKIYCECIKELKYVMEVDYKVARATQEKWKGIPEDIKAESDAGIDRWENEGGELKTCIFCSGRGYTDMVNLCRRCNGTGLHKKL